ncbi:WD40-repeat-containing domain protein [Cladochytrium replicatum]|nr:WD40-repeat-containing domain protein [Cladochytrium replicatum]
MVEAPRTSGQFSHSHVRTNSRAGGSSLRAHKRRGSIGSPEVNVVHSPVHMVHAGAESSSNIGLLMQERSVSPNRVLGGSSGHGKLAHIVAGPTPLTPFPEASGTIRDHEMDSPSHSGRSPNLPSPTMSPTIMHQPVPPQLGASMLGLDNLDGDLPSYVTHLGIDQEQQHMLWAQHRRNISGSFDGSGNPTAAAVEAAARRGAPNFGRLMASVESIVTSFDQLPIALKNYALMHVLRRCPYPTLQFASSLILPTLKRDFLALLPVELSYQILGYVDLRCLGRCAQVSKSWNRVVDGDGAELAVWKRRLILEGWYNKDEVNRAQRRYSRTTRQMYMEEDSSGDVDMADRSSLSVGSRSSSIVSRYPPHLFKKLHRRHHMIRQNWNHGVYEQVSFPGHDTNVVTCLQFDAEKIVAGSDVPPTIHIYDTRTGRLRRKLIGHEGGIWALQYSDSTLVSGSTDRTVRVWDMDSGRCTHLFEGHTSTVRCLIILKPTMNPERGVMEPSEPLIVTGSRDASLRVWRLPDPRRDIPYYPSNGDENNNPQGYGSNPYFRHAMLGHTSSVRALAGAGNVLVSGSYDSTVRVWDLERGECVHVCRGHSEKVYSVGYNHETRRAVSGSMDTTVRVWCTRTGTELFRLDGHTNLVGLLELSPQYLISAAADATLRIWNPETSACLSTLTGHAAAITCFHHDPKLNRIVSGAENGIKVWELSNRAGRGVGASQNGGVIHGRFIRDLMKDVQGVWRVRMDERRLVCAVQRDETRKTSFEVLDFGAGIDDDDDEKYEEDDVEEEEEREGGGGGGSGEDLEDEEGQEGVETEEEYEADVDDVEA